MDPPDPSIFTSRAVSKYGATVPSDTTISGPASRSTASSTAFTAVTPATTTTNTTPPPTPPSYPPTHLLGTPRELRDAIYAWHITLTSAAAIPRNVYGFACARPLVHHTDAKLLANTARLRSLATAVRLVCRQVAAEYAAARARRFAYAQHVAVNRPDYVASETAFALLANFEVVRMPSSQLRAVARMAERLRFLEVRFEVELRCGWVERFDDGGGGEPELSLNWFLEEDVRAAVRGLRVLRELVVTVCLYNNEKVAKRSFEMRTRYGWKLAGWDPMRFVAFVPDGVESLRRVENRIVVPYTAEVPIQERVYAREIGKEGFRKVFGAKVEELLAMYVIDTSRFESPFSQECREWIEKVKQATGHEPTTADWMRRREAELAKLLEVTLVAAGEGSRRG